MVACPLLHQTWLPGLLGPTSSRLVYFMSPVLHTPPTQWAEPTALGPLCLLALCFFFKCNNPNHSHTLRSSITAGSSQEPSLIAPAFVNLFLFNYTFFSWYFPILHFTMYFVPATPMRLKVHWWGGPHTIHFGGPLQSSDHRSGHCVFTKGRQ